MNSGALAGLKEGPPALELGHVPPAEGRHRRVRRRRQLRLVKGGQVVLHLPHLVRDALQAPDLGRVQGGEELVDAGGRHHGPMTVARPGAGCQGSRGYTALSP